jgi:uncharacterized protein (DUF2147 family)
MMLNFLLVLFFTQLINAKDLSPVGIWMVAAEDAKVEIYENGNELEGKIVWLKEPKNADGTAKKDLENPDQQLRSREILGMIFLKGFTKHKDEWAGGMIYDAKSGKTYKAYFKLSGESVLKLRGYVGVPLFGRTEEWKKIN